MFRRRPMRAEHGTREPAMGLGGPQPGKLPECSLAMQTRNPTDGRCEEAGSSGEGTQKIWPLLAA